MSKIAKATIVLMIATMIGKVLGFTREVVLASYYGASMYSDAYLTAVNIPLVIFSTIGVSLETALIPLYFDIQNKEGDKIALKFINNIFNIVLIICILLAIIGLIFTPQIVKIFAMGFEGDTLNLAIEFSKISIISVIFIGLSYMMMSYLHIKNNFTIPGLVAVPKNIIIIISIILSAKYNPYIMIWGTILGIAIEFLFQLPYAIKYGYKYDMYLNLNDEYVKKLMWLICPVIIGVAVNQVNSMIDRTLASTLTEGSISALNYANKLNGFVMALFITSIASVIYPMLSKLSSDENTDKFIYSVKTSINSVIILVMPISIGAIVLANPIIKILFERGEFDSKATVMTSIALSMYSIGMVSTGLRDILGKVFYSLQDTKTPMINGAIAIIMNIILNIILVKYFKIAGLALATSISSIICILLLFRSLKKKISYFGQDKILKTTIKSIIASILMGIVTYFIYKYTYSIIGMSYIGNAISLCISIIVGALIYSALIILLKVEEIKLVKNILIKKVIKYK